jgi:2-oxoisovalerate dehydrogenase E1 component alpha subunit
MMRSRLHVPRPPARPGEKPDFSYVAVSAPGSVARPDPNASLSETESLSREMVRVLDDKHRAVGPWNPHLAPADLELGLRHMMLTRVFDDRMHRAQRQGKITFYMKSTGEEAVSVAQCMAMRPTDMLFPSYRNQGLQIVRGRKLVDLMCQLLSNSRDMCKGRQLPVMYHSAKAICFRSLAISRPSFRRQSAGRWRRRSKAKTTLRPAGSAMAALPKQTSTTRCCSRRSTKRR